jgi:hypothetical protein
LAACDCGGTRAHLHQAQSGRGPTLTTVPVQAAVGIVYVPLAALRRQAVRAGQAWPEGRSRGGI